MTTKLSRLSGGEKAKVYLAKILLEKPDVILMDEPTNFLDKQHIEWLEGYLNNFEGTIIFVSHDRYFINKLATKIAYIHHKTLKVFIGNYDDCKEKILKE